jgi:hypothetical protein
MSHPVFRDRVGALSEGDEVVGEATAGGRIVRFRTVVELADGTAGGFALRAPKRLL